MLRVMLMVFLCIGFAGCVNGHDIKACEDFGHSKGECYDAFKP